MIDSSRFFAILGVFAVGIPGRALSEDNSPNDPRLSASGFSAFYCLSCSATNMVLEAKGRLRIPSGKTTPGRVTFLRFQSGSAQRHA